MIIFNRFLPFKGFTAMALYPFILVRLEYKGKNLIETLNHERIHFKQQLELLIVGFYVLYFIFWLMYGYRRNPFEREAYANQRDLLYLKNRKAFSWCRKVWF